MKKFIALFIAALFLCGCGLSTIEPYKKTGEAPRPTEENVAETIEESAPAVMIQEAEAAVVKEVKEDIVEVEIEEEEIK